MTSFEEKLAALPKPSVEFPQHRAQLRRALLNSERSGSYPLIMSFYKLIPAGLALVLVFGLAFTLRPEETLRLATPEASAQEIVTDAVAAVRGLSDEEVQALDQKLHIADITDLLEEARAAKDLRLADAQFTIESSQENGDTITFTKTENGSELSITESSEGDLKGMSFLTFTRSDGANVLLGMDLEQSYLPQIVLISNGDASEDQFLFNAPTQ